MYSLILFFFCTNTFPKLKRLYLMVFVDTSCNSELCSLLIWSKYQTLNNLGIMSGENTFIVYA